MQYLLPALDTYELCWVSYASERTSALAPAYLMANIGFNPGRMLVSFIKAWRILKTEKPQVILSTGSEIALPFFYLAKLRGIKTIFVESWTRIDRPTLTGRLVYWVSDLFLVQWPQTLKVYGKKARYAGSIL